jgi:glycosyltransferase involved in cell wall biosynthesis
MLWQKGVREFVELARAVGMKRGDCRFVMAGDTDNDNPGGVPGERLQEWHDEGVVEWWGHQQDIAEAFNDSDIVCLPSRYREGVPRVLIEAASAGLPLVTTDMPGCRDVCQDGSNGYLVRVGHMADLQAALERLLDDPDLRSRMGKAGRSIVEKRFTSENVIEDTLSVYNAAVGRRGRGRRRKGICESW